MDMEGRLNDWLSPTLKGISAISALVGPRVYYELAPTQKDGTPMPTPYIVFDFLSRPRTITGVDSAIIDYEAVYMIKFYSHDISLIREAYDAMVATLHRTKTVSGDIYIAKVEYEGSIPSFPERRDQTWIRQRGGQFRIRSHPL